MEKMEHSSIELWKGISTAEAYLSGFEDCGGTLFIPTRDHLMEARGRLETIWKNTTDISVRSFLRYVRCRLDLNEPQDPVNNIHDALTIHLIKGGPDNAAISHLLRESLYYMEHANGHLHPGRWPIEIHAVTDESIGHFLSQISMVSGSDITNDLIGQLRDQLLTYRESLLIHEFHGMSHKERMELLEGGSGHLGRRDIYSRIIQEIYSLPYRAEMIEEKILLELYREVPNLERVTGFLGENYGTEPDTEIITAKILDHRRIGSSRIMKLSNGLRGALMEWANESLVRYPWKTGSTIEEAQPYLEDGHNIGKLANVDGLIDRPSSRFFLNKTLDGSKWISFPDLFLFLVREELGSRAFFLNSIIDPHPNARRVDLLLKPSANAMVAGFSQERELEVLGHLRDMANRTDELIGKEVELMGSIESVYPLDDAVIDLEFFTARSRVISLLKGLADIRLNISKQSMVEFIRWARIVTGISEEKLLEIVFQVASRPGFHSATSLMSSQIREFRHIKMDSGMDPMEFNTYSTRFGYPSWRIFQSQIIGL